MTPMDRRTFLQTSLAAAVAPALPMPTVAAASAPAPMGIAAKYWASYFSTVEGASALHAAHMSGATTVAQAQRIVMISVARGGYSPADAAVRAVAADSKLLRAPQVRIKAPAFDDMPDELRNLRAQISCDCEDAPAPEGPVSP